MSPEPRQDPSLVAYIQNVWDRIAVIGDEALARSAPLFFEPTPGKLSFLASSVVLGVGQAHFLITAGHVFDEATGKALYAGGEAEVVQIGGKWVHSRVPPKGRENDHIDLALLQLEDATVKRLGLKYVPLNETDPAYLPDPRPAIGTYYVCVGFPQGRQSTWVKDGMLSPRQLCLALKPGPSPEMLGQPYNHIENLALEFDKKSAMQDGRAITAPDPVGMSGGGVWACHGLVGPAPARARLVGISTTWLRKKEAIVATRIGLCFDALAEHFPEIADELPKPTWPGVDSAP
jgi:hypothetical protein